MNDSSEVKARECPFCGEAPEIFLNDNDAILIRCSTLGCVAWQHRVPIDMWNRRPKEFSGYIQERQELEFEDKLVRLDEEEVYRTIASSFTEIFRQEGHHVDMIRFHAKAICAKFGHQERSGLDEEAIRRYLQQLRSHGRFGDITYKQIEEISKAICARFKPVVPSESEIADAIATHVKVDEGRSIYDTDIAAKAIKQMLEDKK